MNTTPTPQHAPQSPNSLKTTGAGMLAQRQTEALARTLQLLTTEPDLDRFLGQVLLTMSETLRSPAASLWFYDAESQTATLHLHCEGGQVHGIEAFQEMSPYASALDFPYLLRLEREGRPFVLDDIAHNPLIGDERNRRVMLERGVRSYLKVPLLLEGRFIGNVAVQNNERKEFLPEEIQLAEALAVQVSLAVQLTRLNEEAQSAALARGREQAAQERAEELSQANTRLQAEIVERRQTELVAQGQTAALLKTFARLTENPTLDFFVASVMRATIEQLGQDSGGLWLWDEAAQTTILTVDYEDGETKQGAQITRPGGAHDVHRAWDDRFLARLQTREILVQDVEAEWPRSPHNAQRGIRTRMVLPLFFGEEFLGSLTLRSKTRRDYAAGEIELARALASQVALAIQLAHLAAGAREVAVLDERTRIARDMHDTLAQTFSGIAVHLEAAQVVAPEGRARDLVAQALDLAREGAGEARRGLRALRPQALENSDLSRALERQVERVAENAPARVSWRVVGAPRPLPPRVEENLLRVAQEALTNALRHAGASAIEVSLHFETTGVRLCVRDDGQGFRPEEARRGEGLGLVGMRERIADIGGELSVATPPADAERGTEICARCPESLQIPKD